MGGDDFDDLGELFQEERVYPVFIATYRTEKTLTTDIIVLGEDVALSLKVVDGKRRVVYSGNKEYPGPSYEYREHAYCKAQTKAVIKYSGESKYDELTIKDILTDFDLHRIMDSDTQVRAADFANYVAPNKHALRSIPTKEAAAKLAAEAAVHKSERERERELVMADPEWGMF